jgi:hypothetical protein
MQRVSNELERHSEELTKFERQVSDYKKYDEDPETKLCVCCHGEGRRHNKAP